MAQNQENEKSTISREEWIQLALEKLEDGGTLKGVAKEFGIPVSTLRGRKNGAISQQAVARSKYKLSQTQEELLVDWILSEEAAGRPPTIEGVRGMVTAICHDEGSTDPIGNHWVQRFFKRHSSTISIKKGRLIDTERIQATTEANIEPWFTRLANILTRYDIEPRNIYNMDETGTQEGDSAAQKVAGSASIKGAKVTKSSNTDWVTVIECISATGRRVTPTIIFKGCNLQSYWVPPEGLPRWHYQATPSGWTNSDIAFDWVANIFLPSTPTKNPDQWRLLILDGFATHIDHFFQLICFREKVQLLYLPAHTSHFLQPLDVAVFAPLKAAYRSFIRSVPVASLSSPASKQRFIRAYEFASKQAISISNIKQGFEKTGIWPLNGDKVLEQVRIEAGAIRCAATPPNSTQTMEKELLFTPIKGRDIFAQFEYVDTPNLPSREARSRKRSFLQFAAKRIDRDSMTKAVLRADLHVATTFIDTHTIQKGKKVRINPNEGFARVEEFELARVEKEAAIQQAEARVKAAQAKYDLDARKAYKEIKHVPFDALCHEWQLE